MNEAAEQTYRIEERQLVKAEPGAIVFRQRRRTLQRLPEARRRVIWMNLLVFGLMLALIGLAAQKHEGASWSLCIAGVVLLVVGGIGLVAWMRAADRWKRQADVAHPGVYVVRFEADGGLLIGPLPSSAKLEEAREPVAGELPPGRLAVRVKDSPPWPWSDIDTDADDRTAWLVYLEVTEPPGLDWEGDFSLLDGIEPDLRWYVLKTNPEAIRRHQAALELTGE